MQTDRLLSVLICNVFIPLWECEKKTKKNLSVHPLLHESDRKLCNFFNLTPCLFTKHLMFCCHGDKDPDKTSHAH